MPLPTVAVAVALPPGLVPGEEEAPPVARLAAALLVELLPPTFPDGLATGLVLLSSVVGFAAPLELESVLVTRGVAAGAPELGDVDVVAATPDECEAVFEGSVQTPSTQSVTSCLSVHLPLFRLGVSERIYDVAKEPAAQEI